MRYILLTPKRPDADRWPRDVVKDTFNALAAASGAALPYPEACLRLDIGRLRQGEAFQFNWSACPDGECLNSPAKWQAFLQGRVAGGAIIVTEDAQGCALSDFLRHVDVAATLGR